MTAEITIILFNLIMKSSVMNIHDFGGCNLIFTMTTGKHDYVINVIQRLICLYIIATKVILNLLFIIYFPRDLVKIDNFDLKKDNFGRWIIVVVRGWGV